MSFDIAMKESMQRSNVECCCRVCGSVFITLALRIRVSIDRDNNCRSIDLCSLDGLEGVAVNVGDEVGCESGPRAS